MKLILLAYFAVLSNILSSVEGRVRYSKRPNHKLGTAEYAECMSNAPIVFNRFDASYYTRNLSVVFNILGYSSVDANVTFDIIVEAYGEQRARFTFDPCEINLNTVCPVARDTAITTQGILPVSPQDVQMIPKIAWGIPDFEGLVRFRMYRSEDIAASSIDNSTPLACMIATLNNGHTFKNKVVKALSGTALALSIAGVLGFYVIGMEHSTYLTRQVFINSVPSLQHMGELLQCIAFTGAIGITQPKVLVAWASNFAWILGFITNKEIENSLESFRKHSNGNLSSPKIGGVHRRDAVATNPQSPIPGFYHGFQGLATEVGTLTTNLFTLTLIWFLISLAIAGGIVIIFVLIIKFLRQTRIIAKSSCDYITRYWFRVLFNACMRWVS